MPKLFISLAFALAIAAAALGFMAKNNIDKLQSGLKSTKDDLHREQGKLQTANNDLKKTTEELGTTSEKLKETTATLETKTMELTTKGEQLAEAQKQVTSQTTEIADLKKTVEEGKLVAAELEKMKGDYAVLMTTAQTTQAELAELKQVLIGYQEKRKDSDQPRAQVAQKRPDLMGLQGKILAVNPGWNFVVLSVGDQQGVLMNAPLLVVRGSTPIARLRVTSVERSTSVADVIPSSAVRGISVQPGDKVIFEGRSSAAELTRPAAEPEATVAAPRPS